MRYYLHCHSTKILLWTMLFSVPFGAADLISKLLFENVTILSLSPNNNGDQRQQQHQSWTLYLGVGWDGDDLKNLTSHHHSCQVTPMNMACLWILETVSTNDHENNFRNDSTVLWQLQQHVPMLPKCDFLIAPNCDFSRAANCCQR